MRLIVAIVLLACTLQSIASETINRIAFGSCAMQTKAQPVWQAIAKQRPDLFLFVGDAIYADYDGKKRTSPTEVTLDRDWNLLANEPNFKEFRKQFPIMATWDNHDYGHYQAGVEFEFKELTKKHFLDFFGEPEDSERRRIPGIYDAKIIGPKGKRVQVILLDTRTFKTAPELAKRHEGTKGSLGKYVPNNNIDASLLGKVQWQWLETQLQKPAEVRLLVSSTQVIANQKGMDEWGNYPLERERLFNLIAKNNVENLIILSGNVHFTEISKVQNGDNVLVDFTSSGLTHTNKAYAKADNKYRVANAYDDINFGMVEIDWNKTPLLSIKLSAFNETGNPVIEYTMPLPN